MYNFVQYMYLSCKLICVLYTVPICVELSPVSFMWLTSMPGPLWKMLTFSWLELVSSTAYR